MFVIVMRYSEAAEGMRNLSDSPLKQAGFVFPDASHASEMVEYIIPANCRCMASLICANERSSSPRSLAVISFNGVFKTAECTFISPTVVSTLAGLRHPSP